MKKSIKTFKSKNYFKNVVLRFLLSSIIVISFFYVTPIFISITDKNFKVPHMGWNIINVCKKCPLLNGVDQKEFYFLPCMFYPSMHRSN